MSENSFRLLRADEAEDLVEFIHSIYGPSYPSDLFSDASSIRAEIESNRLFSSVALDPRGRIVGHLATLLERPDDVTGDGITGMVASEARGHNVLSQLGGPLFAVHGDLGIVGLHLYAITLHDISQRRIVDHGGAVTGQLLFDWPADISVTGFSTDGLGDRIPMLMMYFPLGPLPARRVYVPRIYADVVSGIHDRLSLERTIQIVETGDRVVVAEESVVEEKLKPRQASASLRFHRIGKNWSTLFEDWRFRQGETPAAYVDVSLSAPSAVSLIDRLCDQGWYFGGLLLERAGSDFLRLQYGDAPTPLENLQLCEAGRQMHDFVLVDRARVGAG